MREVAKDADLRSIRQHPVVPCQRAEWEKTSLSSGSVAFGFLAAALPVRG